MVGVRHGLPGNVPSLFPWHTMLVHQQTHQLGDGNGRVCVIQLKYILAGKLAEILPMLMNPVPDDVLQAG